jgi:two-component system response regulator YesN
MVLKVALDDSKKQFAYYEYQQIEQIVLNLVGNNPDVLVVKKDIEEWVLIIKGDNPEYLEQERYFLTELIKTEVEGKIKCSLAIGAGAFQKRISDIPISFAEAWANTQSPAQEIRPAAGDSRAGKRELLTLDKSVLENYLKFGSKDDFDNFFETYLQPLGETALGSYIVKNYVFVDIVLATAKFVNKLDGNIDQVIPEINYVETLLMNIKTMAQLRVETQRIFASALDFRDSQAHNQHEAIIHQAKAYIDRQYTKPDLSLNEVAAQVNLSPSHFSTVFSHETGETFKEYLTRIRINRAKELLRTTGLKSFEVAYQCGYNDPHYFSYIFRKNTGLSPQQFRLQPQSGRK